jgi:hypothetical protein
VTRSPAPTVVAALDALSEIGGGGGGGAAGCAAGGGGTRATVSGGAVGSVAGGGCGDEGETVGGSDAVAVGGSVAGFSAAFCDCGLAVATRRGFDFWVA